MMTIKEAQSSVFTAPQRKTDRHATLVLQVGDSPVVIETLWPYMALYLNIRGTVVRIRGLKGEQAFAELLHQDDGSIIIDRLPKSGIVNGVKGVLLADYRGYRCYLQEHPTEEKLELAVVEERWHQFRCRYRQTIATAEGPDDPWVLQGFAPRSKPKPSGKPAPVKSAPEPAEPAQPADTVEAMEQSGVFSEALTDAIQRLSPEDVGKLPKDIVIPCARQVGAVGETATSPDYAKRQLRKHLRNDEVKV